MDVEVEVPEGGGLRVCVCSVCVCARASGWDHDGLLELVQRGER